MRPRVPSLRTKYRECVARLKAAGIPITLASVSTELSLKFHTVRTFMYRNPILARELGLATRESRTSYEYVEAAKSLDAQNRRITTQLLAAALGRNRSVVARFLRSHPGTHARIYEETGQLVGWSDPPQDVTRKKLPNFLQAST